MGSPCSSSCAILANTCLRIFCIGDFPLPCHAPAKIRFSAFIRIQGGKLVITKSIGQKD